jgi:hypothetical protein
MKLMLCIFFSAGSTLAANAFCGALLATASGDAVAKTVCCKFFFTISISISISFRFSSSFQFFIVPPAYGAILFVSSCVLHPAFYSVFHQFGQAKICIWWFDIKPEIIFVATPSASKMQLASKVVKIE